MSRRRCRGPYLDSACHARFEMSGDKASIFKFTCTIEMPNNGFRFAGRHIGHVRLVTLHVRKLAHHFRMFEQLLAGAEHHFAHQLTVVGHHELGDFALIVAGFRGDETHLIINRGLNSADRPLRTGCWPKAFWQRRRGCSRTRDPSLIQFSVIARPHVLRRYADPCSFSTAAAPMAPAASFPVPLSSPVALIQRRQRCIARAYYRPSF
jgi:hypothetical protein